MRDRTETAVVGLTVFAALVAIVLAGLLPSIYSQRLGLSYVWDASFALMWAYSIYWAFSIRRLLSAKRFRDQALGLGLVAIGWASFNYSFLFSNGVLQELAFFFAVLLTFYWLDASIQAGRKSDPLYRDVLRWSELRLVLWALVIVVVVGEWLGTLVDPSTFSIIVSSGLSRNPSPLALALISTSFLAVFIPASVYLTATAVRSKDSTFKTHLGWFGVFAASLLVFVTAGVATSQSYLFGLAYLFGTYSLYRSAKALSPLNRLPIPVASATPAPTGPPARSLLAS